MFLAQSRGGLAGAGEKAMTWSRTALVAGAMTAVLAGEAAAAPKNLPMLLNVGPSVSFEPGNIRITSRVEPSPANRALVIEVDSLSHYSSSEIPLEGDQAPRSRTMFLKDLPAGDYEVIATLRTETGTQTVVRQKFQIVASRENSQ
jgi:hypothetical protein